MCLAKCVVVLGVGGMFLAVVVGVVLTCLSRLMWFERR